MTKRLVALLLSLIMLLGCLVSCGEKDDEIEDIAKEGSEKTITLSMYLMSENEVSEEQALAIQNAVNKITKSKFKTQLVLHFFSEANEDEYYEALEDAYYAWEEADVAADDEEALTGSDTAEETYVDEYGVIQLKYPTIPDYQVDIFYISGYERLTEFIDYGMVSDLSEQVDSSSKVIKSYVSEGYINGVNTVCDGLYAIPTNAPIGEYTYMLLNNDILDAYNHTASDFSDIFCENAQYLLDHVSKYNKDYVPFLSFTDESELDVPNVKYIGVDENGEFDSTKFSLVGDVCTSGQRPSASRLYEVSTTFKSNLNTLSSYKANGYYRKATKNDENTKFAMGYIKGGLEVVEKYKDDYSIVALEAPELNTMDLFDNMFAISPSTADTARSMEILSYLYTNKDFNNLLLYGIEGENYKLVESNVLDKNGRPYVQAERLNNKYVMSPEKLGNMLISYPTVGQPYNLFDLYNEQNIASNVSSIMGMVHDYDYLEPLYLTLTNKDEIYGFGEEGDEIEASEYLRLVSEKFLTNYLNTNKSYDDFFAEQDYMKNNSNLTAAMDGVKAIGEDGDLFYSIVGVYNAWKDANTSNT